MVLRARITWALPDLGQLVSILTVLVIGVFCAGLIFIILCFWANRLGVYDGHGILSAVHVHLGQEAGGLEIALILSHVFLEVRRSLLLCPLCDERHLHLGRIRGAFDKCWPLRSRWSPTQRRVPVLPERHSPCFCYALSPALLMLLVA